MSYQQYFTLISWNTYSKFINCKMFSSEITKFILHYYLRKKTVIFNIPSAIFMDIIYD